MTYVPHFLSSTHAQVTLVHIHHHIINIFAEIRNQTHHQRFILSISLLWCCRCSIFVVELIIFFWKKFILSSTPQLSKSLSAVMVHTAPSSAPDILVFKAGCSRSCPKTSLFSNSRSIAASRPIFIRVEQTMMIFNIISKSHRNANCPLQIPFTIT